MANRTKFEAGGNKYDYVAKCMKYLLDNAKKIYHRHLMIKTKTDRELTFKEF